MSDDTPQTSFLLTYLSGRKGDPMSKSKKLTGITVDVLMYGILLVQML